MKTFLNINDAVSIYGIGKNLLYNAIHNEELRAYRPNGRDFLVKTEEVEHWIESKAFEGKQI